MIAVLALTGTAIIYFLYEPRQHSFYISCPLHSMTGLKCPFCGMQQMAHLLLHGKWGAAFFTNPFLFLLIPYGLLYLYLNFSEKKAKHPIVYQRLYGDKALVVLLMIAVVFGVLRNWWG